MKGESIMAKTIKDLSTNILPIINIDLYGSLISPNCLAEEFYMTLDEDDPRDGNHENGFAFPDYKNAVAQVATDYITFSWLPLMKKYGVISIKNEGIYSPSEYNFTTDRLDFSVAVCDDFEEKVTPILKHLFNNNQNVIDYVEHNWKNRPGYINRMPNTLQDIIKFDSNLCYAAALTILSIHEDWDFDDEQSRFEEMVLRNLSYDDFQTWVI